ncbi:TolC family protein [Chryseobacterium sp. Mn2064]|uniref:TolC family protein n=1 Tax=Chryseobacterium sp. Mn2064 TaxID=3395263 RepID=UPI003BEEDF85
MNGGNGLQLNSAQSQSIGANSSMTLYHAGYIKNNEVSKNLLVQMADLSVQEAQNNITLNITQAFLNILMTQENIVSLEGVLKTTQTQLKQGDQFYKAGNISKLNYLQIQAQVAQDEYNLTSAQNTLRTGIVNLKQILQLPSNYDFQIAKPDSIIVDDQLKSLQEVQNLAQNQRPEVKYGELNVENSNTSLKMAKASIQPTLNLTGNISTNYSYGNGNYFNQLGNNFYMPIGLSLGIPIYNNRIYKTQIEKSKIAIEQANLDLLNTKTVLNQQVEQSYISLQNALSQFDSASKQMNLYQQSYDIMNAQMKIGSIDYVQLQQQRLLYIQSIQNYLQAKYTAVLNKQIYEFYAGNPINLK